MKKVSIYLGFTLILLLGANGYWLSQAYQADATTFDHNVSAALFAVADTMSDQVSVRKESPNYFFVTSNAPASNKTIDTLIQKEFADRAIDLDYEIGIYNAEDDSLIHVTRVKSTSPFPYEDLHIEADGVTKNFAVFFPTRNGALPGKFDLWLFIGVIIAILVWIVSQNLMGKSLSLKKNESVLKAGNCTLDFHNQTLQANGHSYSLTHKENQILKLFFENPNQVIERKVFLETVWEDDGFFVARSMDVFISKIRKHLKADQSIKIENLRSIGYRLCVTH